MFKKSAPKINAPKSEIIDTTESWTLLFTAIQQIFSNECSNLSYEELYRTAYDLVQQRHGESLYDNVLECLKYRVNTIVKRILKPLKDGDHGLLRDVTTEWENYSLAVGMISNVMMYLNRTVVLNNPDDYSPISALGFILFRENAIKGSEVGDRTRRQVLQLIQKERDGETVDKMLIKGSVNMLNKLSCYEQELEGPFLTSSSNYYANLSQSLVDASSVPEYLRIVKTKLKEEAFRVQYYLLDPTKQKIEQIISEEMITNHLGTIMDSTSSGFGIMLRDDKISDLKTQYNIFAINPSHIKELIKKFRSHVASHGLSFVNDEQITKDPTLFIKNLLDLKRKYKHIVKESFDANPLLSTALDEAFRQFADGTVQSRMAEYLSLYLDSLMRSNEQDQDQTLDDVIDMFMYLKDSDVFENYYKTHLSKRLLSSRNMHQTVESQSCTEKVFVTKLKLECGYQFTSKIEGMFNDVRLSRIAMDQFEKTNKSTLGLDFYVNVLTHSFWPTYDPTTLILPHQLKQCCRAFQEHYDSVHNGRRITWQPNLGDGLVIANYPNGSKYELLCTTSQICILDCFNACEANQVWSEEELSSTTGIPIRDIQRQMTPLCSSRHRVIIKDENGYCWNEEFKHASTRLRIAAISTKETTQQVHQTESKIEMDRKPIIEAAIVKIMKSRKTMYDNQLIESVVTILRPTFVPSPIEIKKRVESLVEREFLERDEKEQSLFRYLA
ncbi:cullin [Acrasis kona]|uniref:Cullin n=1 Tax=Acrasis kona TaxID=1008807 RepID=A0AAW2ZQ30_9EUKA